VRVRHSCTAPRSVTFSTLPSTKISSLLNVFAQKNIRSDRETKFSKTVADALGVFGALHLPPSTMMAINENQIVSSPLYVYSIRATFSDIRQHSPINLYMADTMVHVLLRASLYSRRYNNIFLTGDFFSFRAGYSNSLHAPLSQLIEHLSI